MFSFKQQCNRSIESSGTLHVPADVGVCMSHDSGEHSGHSCMCALEIEISTVIIDIYFLTYTYNFLLSMEDHEAREGEPQEELASRETINTPAVTTTQTGKEKYCNFNQNDELLISIIF